MLTNAAAKAATPMAHAYKIADSGGLHLYVAPTGTKSWRLKYRFRGKEKLLTIGQFPQISLIDARRQREEAKARLREGINPSGGHERLSSFEDLALAWYRHNQSEWSPTHAADVLASLERDIFPAIGPLAPVTITAPALLDALRPIEARGCIETARRIRQRLSAIFGYGIAQGLIDQDPAAHLGRAMRSAPPSRPQAALISIRECRAMLKACETAPAQPITRRASRFLALTAVRLDAVRGMCWGELDDLEGDSPIWRVPAARMKLKRAKKADQNNDHVVPLSTQAVALLANMRGHVDFSDHIVDADTLIFPGRGENRPIGEGAIRQLYIRAGYAGRHVPHGWRSSFSTILNEQMGETWRSAIDRALAHAAKDKVEAAYNRSEMLDRRRALFQRWGDLLEG